HLRLGEGGRHHPPAAVRGTGHAAGSGCQSNQGGAPKRLENEGACGRARRGGSQRRLRQQRGGGRASAEARREGGRKVDGESDFRGREVVGGGCASFLPDAGDAPYPKPETRIPNTEYRIPNTESRNPNTEYRIPNPESRIPKPESRIPNPESRILNPEARNPPRFFFFFQPNHTAG
ncbi:hypothetical protein T484DRAFT_2760772, partial [Baffinella frigidus]